MCLDQKEKNDKLSFSKQEEEVVPVIINAQGNFNSWINSNTIFWFEYNDIVNNEGSQ